MKNIYIKTLLFTLFVLQLYLPVTLNAQCMCAASVPATPIVQSITIPPTTISTLNFNFQQFDATVGTLSCVSFTDTVTGSSVTGARNTGPDSTAFLFSLTLSTKIAGPGILISHPFNATYGYDTLAKYGMPGDTITYGPANIISNPTGRGSTGGNAAFIGNGTLPFVFSINGGMITLDGGSNYKSGVTTTIGGTMKLTYYYCPMAILASSLQNFSAFKKDNSVLLKWDAQNAENIDQFEIEYSADGKNFTTVAKIEGNHSPAATYKYDYALNNNSGNILYFRIKQTGNNNKSGYSAIQKISLTDKSTTGIGIYPNPAVTGISLNFDHLLTGDYTIDLVNTAGQVIMNKKLQLSNSSMVALNWNSKPAPGIYFARVTNSSSMERQIARVVIR
jgi:hypothetical protein